MSILKFIERNWGLSPLSGRSLDRLANPVAGADPYVPENRPAIGDMFDYFTFDQATTAAAAPKAGVHARRPGARARSRH